MRHRLFKRVFLVSCALTLGLTGFGPGDMHASAEQIVPIAGQPAPAVGQPIPAAEQTTAAAEQTAAAAEQTAATVPAVDLSVDAGSRIGSIKLDEQRGMLYATATETNELLFIDPATMQIAKRLPVGSLPMGMDLVGNKLYVALSGATSIAVVDLDTQKADASIMTGEKPVAVAVDGNSVYYSVSNTWSGIHRKDLSANSDSIIENNIYEPALAVDRNAHRLYAGETGISRLHLAVYDSTSGSKLWTLDPEEGGYAETLVLNGGRVYYGAYEIDPATKRILSASMGPGLAANESYLYTASGVYTKQEGIPVVAFGDADSPWIAELDAQGGFYTVPQWGTAIRKRVFPLSAPPAIASSGSGTNRIVLNRDLTRWAMGRNEKYAYAIAPEVNRLVQIDTDTLAIAADRYVGSKPTDVDIRDGVIYVTLQGSTHVAKIDTNGETNFMAPIQEIETGSFTGDVAAGSGKAFYSTTGSFGDVYSTDGEPIRGPGSFSRPSLAMAPDGSALYIGETDISTGDLYQVHPATGQILQQSTNGFSYPGRDVIVDGSNVYYGSNRVSAANLNQIYGVYKDGSYNARLLAAKDKLVLAADGIYDRDTFNPVFSFPYPVSNGLVKADGSILLFSRSGSDTAASYSLEKFSGLDELEAATITAMRPASAVFVDEYPIGGFYTGNLTIHPGPKGGLVWAYKLEYEDAAGNPVDGVSTDMVYAYDRQSDGSYLYRVNRQLPAAVKKLGIVPIAADQYGNNQQPLPAAKLVIRLWDYADYLAENVSLHDTDASPNAIGGELTFDKALAEYPGDRYVVYFGNEYTYFGNPIGQVEATGAAHYSLPIPQGTAIPNGALTLVVQTQDQDGQAGPGMTMTEIPDKMSIAPGSDQISVLNDVQGSGSVTVTGLQAGDLVNVYDLDLEVMGQSTVAAGRTSVTVDRLTLDQAVRYLFVTVTSPGKAESFLALVNYSPLGGGGTPGGGGAPASGNGSLTTTEVTKTDHGASVADVTVNDDALEAKLSEAGSGPFRLVLPVDGDADEIRVTLRGDQMKAIKQKNAGTVIEIQGADAGFTVPVGALNLAGATARDASFVFSIVPLSGTQDGVYGQLLSGLSLQQVGTRYDFSIRKVTSGGSAEVREADGYIGHVITLDKPSQPFGSLSAVLVDPASGKIVPVPATFEQAGDRVKATIYRKGNSQYAIVAHTIGFNDLKPGLFAKTAIEQLAGRLVINGYEDGSFKPDGQVTRAEAAAILVKALGIVPAASGSAAFKDVKAGSWYADAVSAAVQAGLFKGYEDGTFRPNQSITQQEMLSILYQAMLYGGYAKNPADKQQFPASAGYKAWSADAVSALLAEGVVKPKEAFPIQAAKATTRAESAELIYRLLGALKLI
ncbi:S-layer homology domain-containing protein [Paenibacillus sp. MWE-103]|uniref:S-layer homology domain-containing protein n=1 Tax=Paenibacillus artemisiicola TaxID=1172618 RepID=A0ABS3WGD8_9BACL|nr:S-layer homology domain-containing protein [Paenibacillus artemisiicola]MBO7747190.1 S-layer homology domain-containing protein [Paenibacillus artemisiicola]